MLAIARRQAARVSIPWWTYFNIAYFNVNDEPTEAQAAWQAFAALAYGARGLLYFYYQNPAPPCVRDFLVGPGILDKLGQPSDHYVHAQRLNSALRAMGPHLMKMQSTAVVHNAEPECWQMDQNTSQTKPPCDRSRGANETSRAPAPTLTATALSQCVGLTNLSGSLCIVGCFADERDKNVSAVLVVNFETDHYAMPTLVFGVPLIDVREVDQNTGDAVPVSDEGGARQSGVQIRLLPGRAGTFADGCADVCAGICAVVRDASRV